MSAGQPAGVAARVYPMADFRQRQAHARTPGFSDPAFTTHDDERTPVTVMLSPTQCVLLELVLSHLVGKYGAIDENRVTDHIFARGLDTYRDALLPTVFKDPDHARTT